MTYPTNEIRNKKVYLTFYVQDLIFIGIDYRDFELLS